MPDDIALQGHNNPPEHIDEAFEALATRGKELADAAARLPAKVTDDDTAGKVATFIKQMKAFQKDSDIWRKERKQPHLDAGRKVDTLGKTLTGIVDSALGQANAVLNAFMDEKRRKEAEEARRREEEARKQREEAERLRKEAEASNDAVLAAKAADLEDAAEHNVAPPTPTTVKSDAGVQAGTQRRWDFEITDVNKIPVKIFRKHLTRDAIEKMMRAAVKAGERDIPGTRIFQNTHTVIR